MNYQDKTKEELLIELIVLKQENDYLKSVIKNSDKNHELEIEKILINKEQANKAKFYFITSVFHELRTPLNAILGFSELLQNKELPPDKQQEFISSINKACLDVINYINDLYAKIKSEIN